MQNILVNTGGGGVYNRNAFTLIELLVVVLIIGVLAAVALPQYTKSVEKSKAAEMDTMLSAIERSVSAVILENGSIPDSLSINDLSVEIPGASGGVFNGADTISTKDFRYLLKSDLTNNRVVIYAYRFKNNLNQYGIIKMVPDDKSICQNTCCWFVAEKESFCKNAGFTKSSSPGCNGVSLGCYKK